MGRDKMSEWIKCTDGFPKISHKRKRQRKKNAKKIRIVLDLWLPLLLRSA